MDTAGDKSQDRLTTLADELGIMLADLWQWIGEFGDDVVAAGVGAFDCDNLPFMGEG